MAKYRTTEKTPRRWRGRPTPEPGTLVEMTEEQAEYEVKLGILVPDDQPGKSRAKSKTKQAPGEAADNEDQV